MAEMNELEVANCTRCPALADSCSQIVNGDGPADADLLFVGEAPGESEDVQGEPFVGRSGTVLTEKLQACGLNRSDIRITNCVRCRPPDNRDPQNGELENCRGWLESEVEAVDPEIIVTLGKVPSEHLLERDVAVTNEAGTIEHVEIAGVQRNVLVCVHPAAMLYDRSQEDTLEETVRKAAEIAGAERNGGQSRLGDY